MRCRFCESSACYDQVACGRASRLEIEDGVKARANHGKAIKEKDLHPEDATAHLLRVAGDLLAKWRKQRIRY